MSRAAVFLLFASLNAGIVYGMDCSLGQSSNFLEKFVNSCPGPFDSSEKSYCCPGLGERKVYCCDVEEFALKAGLGIVVPVIIAVAVIISLITICISCLCCSCCPWYRRRHRGTVYGKVQVPRVVHVIQTPANVPHASRNQATVYTTNVTGPPQAPPQYSNEMYAKQAPYNPNYLQ